MKEAIEEYVRQDTHLRDVFLLHDTRDGSILKLSFDHIHEDVHTAEDSAQYACVDFKDGEGNIYDVDVHMERKGATYRPVKLVLHKVNGEVVVPK